MIKARNDLDESYNAVEKSTRRIAFLGTPFQGSAKAGWASLGTKLARMLGETNQKLLDDLKQGCPELATLADEFQCWLGNRDGVKAPKVEITCFKEALTTGSIGMVRVVIPLYR